LKKPKIIRYDNNSNPYGIFTVNIWIMLIFPKAKINIGLRIIEKRSDGYHNIETVFFPIGLRDAIEFIVPGIPLEADHLTVTGNITDCRPFDNLVIKAVIKFRKKFLIPFLNIHLYKVIPVGAGLGGGSSDAANMLKSLNRFFNAGLDIEELKILASEIGSDCSFFIESIPVFAEGRGEIIRPLSLNLEGYHFILLNPGIHVSTKESYENCIPHKPINKLEELVLQPLTEWKNLIINDFEEIVFKKYPIIKDFKEKLYRLGAVYSSMSGSGSVVYGIFNKKPDIPVNMRGNIIYSGV
jgi:4-diphosphocytidyl-2-C-methyl-D-erythritol kinase